MAESLRDVKNRIVATSKTSQITNAMNMVSASKLRKSEKKHNDYKIFMQKIEDLVENVAEVGAKEYKHPMLSERNIKKTGYILITSDKGLAGPYNSNVFKKMEAIIKEKHSNNDYIIGVLGKKGLEFCKRKKLNYVDHYVPLRDDVIFDDVVEVSRKLIEAYVNEEIDKLVIIYNDYVNVVTQNITEKVLLPIENEENSSNELYEYEQGIEKTLDLILPMYIENSIYGIILNSKTSEHASRMTAMQNATDNAKDVIKRLELIYNRARQAAITLELTDIIGGASAVE